MSGVSVDVAAVTAVHPDAGETPPSADRATSPSAGWWRAWRDRFGLAEVCGTLAAVAGFAIGYAQAGSLLAAAAGGVVGGRQPPAAVGGPVSRREDAIRRGRDPPPLLSHLIILTAVENVL